MNSFLLRVAQKYYLEFKDEISDFVFVFPNQRAGMFFQNELSKILAKPLFSPEIITVDACFKRFTNLKTADRTDMIFRLYKQFVLLTKQEETFDNFVFWGDMILNDFNEIDKYLADANQIFSNISDIKEIENTYSYLSEEQITTIETFWKTVINSSNLSTSQNFKSLWVVLSDLYENFTQELKKDGIGYEGLVNRDSIRCIRKVDLSKEKNFVFVGFNALNACERELFKLLNSAGKADFYWDYESLYLQDPQNIAAKFKISNGIHFPSKFDLESSINLENTKSFYLYNVPSTVGQAKIVNSILTEINPKSETETLISTSVVLPDESLLLPVIQSIPTEIEKINVTMGYPLSASSVAAFIELFLNLHKKSKLKNNEYKYYYKDVLNLLNHPLILNIDSQINLHFQKTIRSKNLIYVESDIFKDSQFFSKLFTYNLDYFEFLSNLLDIIKEIQIRIISNSNKDEVKTNSLDSTFLFQYYTTINRFKVILQNNSDIQIIRIETLIQLLKQLSSTITVPFIGEPLEGLQIMGVLETRGIDFENLIICSFNDGIYPSKSNTNSFIPYNIRKGFGLPTYEHNDSVTAYNFYSLISRAQNIYFITDSRSENGNSSEISRFYSQLKYLYNIHIELKSINPNFKISDPSKIEIIKDSSITEKLKLYTLPYPNAKSFSASALNTYIDCSLKFYYQYIEGMREEDDLKELIEYDLFGTIFHKAMELLYQSFIGRIVDAEALNSLNSMVIENAIIKAFNLEYFKNNSDVLIQLEGNNILIMSILKKYISQVIKTDKQLTPFKVISLEEKISTQINTSTGLVNLYGVIDRVHEKDNTIYVLDYKTGSGNLDFQDFKEIFNSLSTKRPKYALQTMLYGYFYKGKLDGKPIAPGIVFIKDTFKDGFKTSLTFKPEKKEDYEIDNYYAFADQFEPELVECIDSILNPNIPFVQCEDSSHCTYCNFNSICQR